MSMTARATTFAALGTSVFVAVRDPRDLDRAHRLARRILREVDEVCSRFRPDSDLSRVNASPGRWLAVDPLLVAAVDAAIGAARATDGLTHPLLGRNLVELGYDRDFELLDDAAGGRLAVAPLPDLRAWERIALDPEGGIQIPDGTALDLGATGKAWAADVIATAFEDQLADGAIISVGGDLRVARPDGRPWQVAISERPSAAPDEVVTVDAGGLATSTTQVRRWSRAGARLHHLIDPRTGQPAAEVWRSVTATGPTCLAANTASTAAIVLGVDALGWLAAHAVTARLVAADGQVEVVGRWPVPEVAR